jgi:hypothetical protein
MMRRMTSLAYTPGCSRPVTRMRRSLGLAIARQPVASTSRSCEVPIPKASAPKAPWVLVWEDRKSVV